jgi:acetate kinase
MSDVILTLNAGSSSLKLGLFELCGNGDVAARLRGGIEDPGGGGRLTLRDAAGATVLDEALPAGDHDEYLPRLLDLARGRLGADRLVAAGHRVVHGGARHSGPARVDDALLRELAALTPLAPLHQGHNLAPIAALRRLEPDLPQVACFDTAFHHTMPDVAARFALPRELEAEGVRRYGAHGLSYEYIASHLAATAPELARGRVVVAHLGGGASLCAMADGRSVDTTMGMTPLDGLVMGTRCGALDPGVVLYLLAGGRDLNQVQDMLYHRSGLLGVSGRSADMRALVAINDGPANDGPAKDGPAAAAVELFVWRLTREIAAMVAALRGLDALVFTGGIGEHSAAVRAAAGARLGWLGIDLDEAANRAGAERVSSAASRVVVLVLPTDEETVIARHTRRVLEA